VVVVGGKVGDVDYVVVKKLTSTLIPANRLPMVPVDSSAAKIPLPVAEMARAVATSSAV
jgi:hypothetical protein